MRKILILVACAALAGCGSMLQAVNAYGAVAVDNAKATNDTIVTGWKLTGCALPLSAILRHPEIIPSLKALCPGAAAAGLLDPVKVQP